MNRRKILNNICEYNYIIDQPPMTATTTSGMSFLPKLTKTTPMSNEYTNNLNKKVPVGSSTSMGPFYNQYRSYANSQMDLRRESGKVT